MRSASSLAAVVAMALAADTGLSAHRLDELLQAARIGITDEGVELQLDLTPGVAVAGAILGEIDIDRDGSLSEAEQRAYVSTVLQSIRLSADDQPLDLSLTSFTFPALDAIRDGAGPIAIQATAPLESAPGPHTIALTNAFQPERSVYLANALVPGSDRIAVRAQRRDGSQSELLIDFSVAERSAAPPAVTMIGFVALLLGAVGISARIIGVCRSHRNPIAVQ